MKTLDQFKASNNKIVKGKELKNILNAIANDLITSANKIRIEDTYASHVTEIEKDHLCTIF